MKRPARHRRFLSLVCSGLLAAVGLLGILGCPGGGSGGGGGANSGHGPQVSSVIPSYGTAGDAVAIIGTRLKGATGVTLAGKAVKFTPVSDYRINFRVPAGAGSGKVVVTTPGGSDSSPYSLTVATYKPLAWYVVPSSGPPGSQVEVSGSWLAGATEVRFGGVKASDFAPAEDGNSITATVPASAASGRVTVVTPGGSDDTVTRFQVTAAGSGTAFIHSYSPAAGPVDLKVTLNGSGFTGAHGVAFGTVPATCTVVSDSQIDCKVPAGASGKVPIVLTTAGGDRVYAKGSFEVVAGGVEAPVVTDFNPKTGNPGDLLTVEGEHLGSVTGGTVAGNKGSFYPYTDTKAWLFVPRDQTESGPVVLNSPLGDVEGPEQFILNLPGPQILGVSPRRGPSGTVVVLSGVNLGNLVSVAFGGVPAPVVHSSTATQVRVEVPPGTRTGPITLTTSAGTFTTKGNFTVGAAAYDTDLFIAGLYLTQATQRLDRSVPLVAGRKAMLRVFVQANKANSERPSVRVRIVDGHDAILKEEVITATAHGVPTDLREGQLGQSWNLLLPGDLIRPGIKVLAELLAPAAAGATPAVIETYPDSGLPLVLDVRQVPPFGITLFPVKTPDGQVGNVTRAGRSKESWVQLLRKLYPLPDDLDVKVGAEYTTTRALGAGDSYPYSQLRNDLEAQRLLDVPGNWRYYYGVYHNPPGNSLQGIGDFGASGSNLIRTALGYDLDGLRDGDNYPDILAHEIGHTLGLRHSPCGYAAGPDSLFPYAEARLGSYGLDLDAVPPQSKDPNVFKDIMSYCSPVWVSDYIYKKVLDFRSKDPTGAGRHGARHDLQDCLLASGTLLNGKLDLEPAIEVRNLPSPVEPGPYTLECLDGAGQVLAAFPFQAHLAEDSGPDTEIRSFAFLVPMTPAMSAGLVSLRVTLGGLALPTRSAPRPDLPGAHGVMAVRAPVAKKWHPGTVHLSWDAGAYPMVLVQVHGQTIARAYGGAMEFATDAHELELVMCSGVRSVTRRARVED